MVEQTRSNPESLSSTMPMPSSSSDTHPWIDDQMSCAVSVSGPSAMTPAAIARSTAATRLSNARPATLERTITGFIARERAQEHQLVHHGVRLGEGTVAAARFPQRFIGISYVGDGGQCLAQPFEALDEEGLDDPVLRVEMVVDAHWSHTGGRGDAADGERFGSLGLQDLDRGGEQHLHHVGARGPTPGRTNFRHPPSVLKNTVL